MIEFRIFTADGKHDTAMSFPFVPSIGDTVYFPGRAGGWIVKRRIIDLGTGKIGLLVEQ